MSVLGTAYPTPTGDGRVVIAGTPARQPCYLDQLQPDGSWSFGDRTWTGGIPWTSPAGLVGLFRVSVWDGISRGGYWRGRSFILPIAPAIPYVPPAPPVVSGATDIPPPPPPPPPVVSPPTPPPAAAPPATPGLPTPTAAWDGLCLPAVSPFGLGCFALADITQAPLHPNSAAIAAELATQVATRYGGVAAFNVHQFNLGVALADTSTPRQDMTWVNAQHKPYEDPYWAADLVGVPIPAGARAASGTDAALAILDLDERTVREFWQAHSTAGAWSAVWGGEASLDGPGYFDHGLGASASGIVNSAVILGIRELLAALAAGTGVGHALAVAAAGVGPWTDYSWPAQRADGSPGSTSLVWEGMRLRLPATVDVDGLHATRGLRGIGRVIARTAQTHGLIVCDQAGAVSISTESGNAIAAATGVNPWTAILGATPDYEVLSGFPWELLEVVALDWGKP